MQSHIRKVYACLAVTCHLHFWQNDQGLLRATAVTRGWNGYRNKSQHRKLTRRRKFSRRSCRDSNPRPFDHESGALTTELSPPPTVTCGCTWKHWCTDWPDRTFMHPILLNPSYPPTHPLPFFPPSLLFPAACSFVPNTSVVWRKLAYFQVGSERVNFLSVGAHGAVPREAVAWAIINSYPHPTCCTSLIKFLPAPQPWRQRAKLEQRIILYP